MKNDREIKKQVAALLSEASKANRGGPFPSRVDRVLRSINESHESEARWVEAVIVPLLHTSYRAGRASTLLLPSREVAADTILIFFTKPDDAEVILGDLLEQMEKVRARKSAFVTWLWFWWEVAWVVVKQGGARVREHTILGRLADAFVRRVGR